MSSTNIFTTDTKNNNYYYTKKSLIAGSIAGGIISTPYLYDAISLNNVQFVSKYNINEKKDFLKGFKSKFPDGEFRHITVSKYLKQLKKRALTSAAKLFLIGTIVITSIGCGIDVIKNRKK